MDVFPKKRSRGNQRFAVFRTNAGQDTAVCQGELHSDYHPNMGKKRSMDGLLCNFLRINHDDLHRRVLEGGTDQEILEWCYHKGRHLNEGDVLVWNAFVTKFGWNDFRTPWLERRKRELGISDRTDIQTLGELFDYEEGHRNRDE